MYHHSTFNEQLSVQLCTLLLFKSSSSLWDCILTKLLFPLMVFVNLAKTKHNRLLPPGDAFLQPRLDHNNWQNAGEDHVSTATAKTCVGRVYFHRTVCHTTRTSSIFWIFQIIIYAQVRLFIINLMQYCLTVNQTMASINSKGYPILRSSTNASVSGRRIRAVCEGLWEQDQPTALGWDGCQSGQRNRQFVCSVFIFPDRLRTWPFSTISLSADPQIHLAFLTSLLSRIDTVKSKEAHTLLLASIAHAKLLYGDLEGTKSDMDAAWKILDTLEGVENGVNAAYYGVGADYYKVGAFL